MRRIHLDAVGGVAGDMFAAALLDACPELLARVMADVRAVVPPSVRVELVAGQSNGLACRRLLVDVAGAPGPLAGFSAMRAHILAAALTDGTAAEAVAILTRLGEAEAGIHGVDLAEVHFHEIADWDSLADVVAAGSLIAALRPAVWSVSDLPLGGGLVRSQHGMLPVPAPATAALLAGFGFRDDGVGGERVTPTGAAILAHLAPGKRAGGGLRLAATGTGAGTRDLPGMANILRAMVFDEAEALETDRVAVLCFDIDDMTGEEIGAAADRLREVDGVLDLTLGAAQGKKGRPVTRFTLLAREAALEAVTEACLRQTSTLGLRWRVEQRVVLARAAGEAGGLRVKTARRPGGDTAKAESDDLRAAPDLSSRRALQRRAEAGG